MTDEKKYFLQNVTVLYDTREQKNFEILKYLAHYGVKAERKTFHTADYSFEIDGADYRERWLGERKGSLGELYGNVTARNKDTETDLRNNLEEELKRKCEAGVDEFVLFVEGVDSLRAASEFVSDKATEKGRYAGHYIYGTIMSWQSNNRYAFKICCCKTQREIAAEMLSYMFYYWRNDMKRQHGERFLTVLRKAKKEQDNASGKERIRTED